MLIVFNSGGTNTRVGVSADGEALVKTANFATQKDFDRQIKTLTETAKEMLSGNKPRGVAGGVAGVWNPEKTKLFRSPHLPDWEKQPFKAKLEKAFDCRVLLTNDAETEGLGEAKFGAGRRKRIVAYLVIGTGIGGVKIEDGRTCAYTNGFEPGHQIMDVDGEVGFWEDFASGSAMTRIYGRKPESIDDDQIWEKETRLLAIGIHNLLMLWSPEIVILGGGVAGKIKLDRLKEVVAQQTDRLPRMPEIVYAELKDKSGLYGALTLLKDG